MATSNQIAIGEATNNTGYRFSLGYGVFGGQWCGVIQTTANGVGYPVLLNPSGGCVGIGSTTAVDGLTITDFGGGSYGQLRMAYGHYGVVFRNDGVTFYMLTTVSGAPYGTWKTPFPFQFDLASGAVTIGGNLTVNGTFSGGVGGSGPVSSIMAGLGVHVNSPTGAVTISIGQDVSTTAAVTFSGVAVNGNVVATGIANFTQYDLAGSIVISSAGVGTFNFVNSSTGYQAGSTPVIDSSGQFTGTAVSIGSGAVTCGAITSTSETCSGAGHFNSMVANGANLGGMLLNAQGFQIGFQNVIDINANFVGNSVAVGSGAISGGSYHIGGTTVINTSGQFTGLGINIATYGITAGGYQVNTGSSTLTGINALTPQISAGNKLGFSNGILTYYGP